MAFPQHNPLKKKEKKTHDSHASRPIFSVTNAGWISMLYCYQNALRQHCFTCAFCIGIFGLHIANNSTTFGTSFQYTLSVVNGPHHVIGRVLETSAVKF